MLGAIIGDVAGSYYEVCEIEYFKKTKSPRPYEERIKIMDSNTPLFTENSSCTDDSILTYAIYKAIKENKPYEESLKEYGLKEIELGLDQYGRSRFGQGFVKWLLNEKEGNSYGNGAAMRIAPVGFMFEDLETVLKEAELATIPSHNNDEAIKSSKAVASAIFLLRKGYSKEEVLKYIQDNYYALDYDLEKLRHEYTFSSKASNSVPQALFIFFKSDSFEDAIRKAISIGGDSDTIACITGALAESYYGIEENIIKQVVPYLKDYMVDILERYQNKQYKIV